MTQRQWRYEIMKNTGHWVQRKICYSAVKHRDVHPRATGELEWGVVFGAVSEKKPLASW